MRARGYDTSDIVIMDQETFANSDLKMLMFETTAVFLIERMSVKFELVRFLNEQLNINPSIEKFILIVWEDQKGIKVKDFGPGKNVEIFFYEKLQFDIMAHKYQPHFVHMKPTDEGDEPFTIVPHPWDKTHVAVPRRAEIAVFPTMVADDPIAKWYGAKPGDIFQVFRTNKFTGLNIAYRRVV